MVFIIAEDYKNAKVDVIRDNENYLWVKMKDVQDVLGFKNIRDRLRRAMQDIFENKNLTEEQKQMDIRTKNEINKNLKNSQYTYVRNDTIEKIIKNCRGVKSSNDGINRLDREKPRENFRQLLVFKKVVMMD